MSFFTVTGINYKSADIHKRNSYALTPEQQKGLLKYFAEHEVAGASVLSTCNRTEIYAQNASNARILNLWMQFVNRPDQYQDQDFYGFTSLEALRHLCHVTAGVESQIPGDYEIVSQVKKSFQISQENGMLSGHMERFVNAAIHVSKRAKTETAFSTGTSSVSYAVAKAIKRKTRNNENARILIIGLGKIGTSCVKHLNQLLPQQTIHITNRTFEKAKLLEANRHNVAKPIDILDRELNYNIIVLATQAETTVLQPEHFTANKTYLLYDLTLPSNVHPAVSQQEHVRQINIDQVSSEIKKNLANRLAEKNKVLEIVEEELQNLGKWWYIKHGLEQNGDQTDRKEWIQKIRHTDIPLQSLFDQADNHAATSETS